MTINGIETTREKAPRAIKMQLLAAQAVRAKHRYAITVTYGKKEEENKK